MLKFLKKYFAVLTGLLVFTIYLTTLAPTVIQIDAGELAAVQILLGIAHPTGYPLFTMVGHLFSLIPFPMRYIYSLNMLSAVWCSLGAGIFTYTVKLVLDNLSYFNTRAVKKTKLQKKTKKLKKQTEDSSSLIPEAKKYFASILSGLILAFGRTYWFQGTSVEVYSLQIFLFTLIIFFLIKAYIREDKAESTTPNKEWIMFSIMLALGFSNHMTTLLILPGAAYLYFVKYKFNLSSIKRIGLMLLIFVPLLAAFYSYLPIRALQKPLLNWGNPIDLERILRHVSGRQYQVWLFSSSDAAKKQLAYFINNLPAEFGASLFIALFGSIASYFTAKKFFVFALITFLFTVLYSVNYDINDIDSYFLLAYISLAFFSAFGIVKLLTVLKLKRYSYSIPAGIIVMFVLVQFYFNYDKVNQSDVYTFEDYTKAVISSTTKNSIMFTYQWDYLVSPSYYFQSVENFRNDEIIIDKELLRRSWYYTQLDTRYPGLLNPIRQNVAAFLSALAPFERNESYNANLLEYNFRSIMTNLVASNITKGDFYIAPELFDNEMQKGEFVLPNGYAIVPDLLLFKVVKGKGYVPAADPNFRIRFPKEKNKYTNFIENAAGSMLARRALYEMQFDKLDRAKLYISKIETDFPDYIIPPGLLKVLQN